MAPGTPTYESLPVVFDVDYADGLTRPNTILSVFNEWGQLVLYAEDSNIADDRLPPLVDGDLSELSTGSAGPRDPYIGTVMLPEGNYFAAVTSNARVPEDLLSNPRIRREPITSVRRLVEDHLDLTPRATAEPAVYTSFLLDTAIEAMPAEEVAFYVISDVEDQEDETDLITVGRLYRRPAAAMAGRLGRKQRGGYRGPVLTATSLPSQRRTPT